MFFVLLCIVCIQDVRRGKISNILVTLILVLGGIYCFCLEGWPGLVNWFAKILLYVGILYPLYKLGAMGAGDVKVLAALEAVFSWKVGFNYFVCVWFLSGVVALLKVLSQRNLVERLAYFFSYARDVIVTGNWQFYHEEREDCLKKDRTVRMSVPFLLGFVLCMGG